MKKIYVCRVCGKVNEFDTNDVHPTTRLIASSEGNQEQADRPEYYIVYCQYCHAWNLSLLDANKPVRASTH